MKNDKRLLNANIAFWEGYFEGLKVTPEEKKIAEQAIAREKKLRKLRKRATEYGYAIRRHRDGYNFVDISLNFFSPIYDAMSLNGIEQVLDEWDAQDSQDDEDE